MPIHGNGGHAKVVQATIDGYCGTWQGWLIAVGDNAVRRKEVLARPDLRYAALIHPSAIVSPKASIGVGTVVLEGAIIQADVLIGKHVIVNCGAVITHDCIIEDYAHIAPGVHLCGGVFIGEGALIGVGCNAIPQARVEPWTVVRGGSLIR